MSDTCEFCGTALAGGPGKGRPRKYCGDACRQAAHRRRLLGAAAAPRSAAPPLPESATPAEPRPARMGPAPRAGGYGPSAGDAQPSSLQELLRQVVRLASQQR
ncbi:hypothetical protein ACFW20_30290 [Streptomyces nigra]|uniref:hypothetical protein n=1 Tax=Streptomyces nigra TaxID=1827580 RepID=UPI00363D0D86